MPNEELEKQAKEGLDWLERQGPILKSFGITMIKDKEVKSE